uniref:Uncharacterized protein n=1 Tax=Rhizophora mucronata TaxID=61149 RepID=A0A2P2PJG6_RHIMU
MVSPSWRLVEVYILTKLWWSWQLPFDPSLSCVYVGETTCSLCI